MNAADKFKLIAELAKMANAPGITVYNKHATIVENPQHTENLFGELSEIAGERLLIMDSAKDGSGHLCLVKSEKQGEYLVDVDVRDIEEIHI